MAFDNIPEDYRPSYPCEKCDEGNIAESEEFPGVWECDTCGRTSAQSEPSNPGHAHALGCPFNGIPVLECSCGMPNLNL